MIFKYNKDLQCLKIEFIFELDILKLSKFKDNNELFPLNIKLLSVTWEVLKLFI